MQLSPKVLILVAVVSILGFGVLVYTQTRHESDVLLDAHRERSEALAASIATGIQNVMLTGKAVLAEELVQDTRALPGIESLRIYDREGFEVFLPREKRTGNVDAAAQRALAEGRTLHDGPTVVHPMKNDAACHRCHEAEAPWRGALAVTLAESVETAPLVVRFVETALENVMISGEADEVVGFLDAITQVEGVVDAWVLDAEGDEVFGEGTLSEAQRAKAEALLKSGGNGMVDGTHLRVVPNAEPCHVCHGDDHEVRGLIAVTLDPQHVARADAAGQRAMAVALYERSLEQLMLSDRGNQLDAYVTQLRRAPEIGAVGLYDADGVEVYPPQADGAWHRRGEKTKDAHVLAALGKGRPQGYETDAAFVQVLPMANEVRCQACHGSDHEVRGAVTLGSDLGPARRAVQASVQRGTTILLSFVVGVSLLLWWFLRRFLVHPVVEIADVAHAVGQGNLGVQVQHASGDEIGRLAREMNEMIVGLRGKLMMERFVGSHTKRMIDQSIRGAADSRAPVRRKIAVLFSDVRGFTSYSERHPPERVIETLNVYLGLQADVVARYGGYVDKFVGDEVMALFEGPDMERRAVEAGLEMIRVVTEASGVDDMHVGVGINAGEAVFGSTGSEGRQDYTVIGDVVNLAARLCSAASADRVIVSEAVRDAMPDDPRLGERTEIRVKGKAEAIGVFEVEQA